MQLVMVWLVVYTVASITVNIAMLALMGVGVAHWLRISGKRILWSSKDSF